MSANVAPLALLRPLWQALPPARRRAARVVALVALACVVAELAALESLRRLLMHAMAPGGGGDALGTPLAVFLLASLLMTALRLAALRGQDRLVLGVAGDLSFELFRAAVRQPVGAQQQQAAGELFGALDKTQQLTNGALGPLMIGLNNGVVGAALILYLAWLAPLLTLAGGTLLALLYLVIGRVTRPRLQHGSAVIARLASLRLKVAHEAQAGYRDIVLNQAQALAEREFGGLERTYRARQGETRYLASAPRYVVELAILALIGAAVVVLTRSPGAFAALVPMAGTLAVGAQRLLPLLNNAHLAWGQVLGHSALMADVLALVQRPRLQLPQAPEPLPFAQGLALEAVTLQYPGRPPVLRGVDLALAPGERLGIVGMTGAGKSSLLDVLLGLLPPTTGVLRVDGVPLDDDALRARWQASVALVPQAIYLPDRPLRELIVYPDDPATADPARIAAALTAARLDGFVATLPHGLETRAGDRGLRLSGGQRQRIALARALYRRPRLLVLDEATGQLDADTEHEIVDELQALGRDVTLVVVSHRRAALRGCDRTLELRDGVLQAPTVALAG